MINRSLTLVCIFFSLYANGQVASEEIFIDSSLWELVIPIEISEERKKVGNIVSLSRKDFITMPASFDDPSRLLMNYGGFANSNDQNNGIIYHAMPSHFAGWQVNGSEIVSPNHLSNAGFFSYQLASSSGGVNAFSGQVIGDYQFRGSPDVYQQSNYLAGVSDISLRTPYKNQLTLNASLLGMEVGADHRHKEFSVMANYRYSTVGLLSEAGLDFGREEINYQDAVIKVQLDSVAGGKASIFALYGKNSNFKPSLDIPSSEVASLDDFEFHDINAEVLVTGAAYEREVAPFLFQTAINYSKNETEGTSIYVNELIDLQKMLSFNSSLTYSKFKHQFELAIRGSWYERNFTPLWGGESVIDKRRVTQNGLIYKYNPNQRLYFTMAVFMPYLSYQGTSFSSQNILPKLGVTWINSSYRIRIDTKYSQNKQFYNIPNGAPLYPLPDNPKSHNFSLDFSDQKTGLKAQFFYHYIDLLLQSSNNFSAFSSLDESVFQNFNTFSQFTNNSSAHIYGASLSFSEKISETSSLSGNVSLITGKQKIQTDTTSMDQNIPYTSNLTSNFHFKKQQLFVKNLDFQVGLHYRNGKYTPSSFSADYTKRLPDFFRADLRFNYHFRKNKNRFKSMLSLDIQNVTNRQNGSYYFYDFFSDEEILETQLGIIPVLSWRVVI